MNTNQIKKIYENSGSNDQLRTEVFTKKLMEMINSDKSALTVDDMSIKSLHEAVSSKQFPIIMGTLLSKVMIESYNNAALIGDALTTKFKSNIADENVPGATLKSSIGEIKELQNYKHTGDIQEKYVTISHKKYGEILDISEEALKFDRTGLILLTARDYATKLANLREKLILNAIQDVADYYAWYPSGTRAAMYSTGTTAPHVCSNQITNALADYTDLDAAKVLFGKVTDDEGDVISVMPKTLLVPVALDTIARRLVGNSVLPGASNAESNPFKGAYNVLSSSYLDAQSSIIWYLGDFQKQFLWKEVTPLQVQTRNDSNNEAAWNNDIAASFKIRFDGQCRSRDFRYVVKSTGVS